MSKLFHSDLALLSETLREAGQLAARYHGGENRSWLKSGRSPVSEADHAVNDFLEQTLRKARPDYGWFSEESDPPEEGFAPRRTFIVDPIDGTRGFLEGSATWCVSVAIVEDGRPVVGVLDAPMLDQHYTATVDAAAALNGTPLTCDDRIEIGSATGSKKLNALMAERFQSAIAITDYIPSLAMRIALVAKGDLDVAYARSGAHDWDLAAADLILQQAGGSLVDEKDEPVRYDLQGRRAPALIAAANTRKIRAIELAKSTGILH